MTTELFAWCAEALRARYSQDIDFIGSRAVPDEIREAIDADPMLDADLVRSVHVESVVWLDQFGEPGQREFNWSTICERDQMIKGALNFTPTEGKVYAVITEQIPAH